MPWFTTVYTKQANTNQGQQGCLEVANKQKWEKWEIHHRDFSNIVPNQSVQGKSNIKDIFLLVQDRKVFELNAFKMTKKSSTTAQVTVTGLVNE